MSAEILTFLYPPLLALLVLTGMHAYFGVQVIERGALFAGLALAQISALGTSIGYLTGHDLHSATTYAWSVACTIAGAAFFALPRLRRAVRIPREAVLGIVYALAAAAAILALSFAPEGTEHIEDMLVGDILAVSKHTVAKTAGVYAAIALFHWIFRKKFRAASGLWDFLFYASLGVVVTASVPIAGVLLVFSSLVIPPVAAMLFSPSTGKRLAIAWTMGALASTAAILIAFRADLPTAATIVCMFGIVLLLMGVARLLIRSQVTGHR